MSTKIHIAHHFGAVVVDVNEICVETVQHRLASGVLWRGKFACTVAILKRALKIYLKSLTLACDRSFQENDVRGLIGQLKCNQMLATFAHIPVGP